MIYDPATNLIEIEIFVSDEWRCVFLPAHFFQIAGKPTEELKERGFSSVVWTPIGHFPLREKYEEIKDLMKCINIAKVQESNKGQIRSDHLVKTLDKFLDHVEKKDKQ